MAVCFTNEEDKRKFDMLSSIVGEVEAMADVVRHNGLVRSPAAVIKDLENDFLKPDNLKFDSDIFDDVSEVSFTEKEIRQSYEKILTKTNVENSEKALNDFSKRLGIPVQFYKAKLGSNVNAFYSKGVVYLAEGQFSSDNVFHEFAHPIVKSLAKDNIELFDKLYNDLLKTEVGVKIYNSVEKNYKNEYVKDSQEFREEVMVQALTEANAEEIEKRSAIGNILYNIKRILRKIFGRTIDLSNLSGKTKLKDFVVMINLDSFDLDQDFLNVDDVVYLMKEFNIQENEINDKVKIAAQGLITEFAEIISNQSLYLKKSQNLIYPEFTTEENEGILDNMNLILNSLKGSIVPVEIGRSEMVSDLTRSTLLNNQQIADRLNTFINQILKIDTLSDILEERYTELKNKNFQKFEDIEQLFFITEILEQYKSYLTKAGAVNNPIFNNPLSQKLKEINSKVDDLLVKTNDLKISTVVDVLYESMVESNQPGDMLYKNNLAYLKKTGTTQEYNRVHVEYYGLTPQELDEYNTLDSKTRNVRETERFLELQNKKNRGFTLTKEEFKNIMTSTDVREGLLKALNNNLESYMYNQDTVVGTFYSYIKGYLDRINAMSNSRQSDLLKGNVLDDLFDAAGLSGTRQINSPVIGRKLGEIVDVGEINEKGELVESLEWRFKSASVNYEGPLKVLKDNINNAKINYDQNPTTVNKLALYQAQNELFFELKNEYVQKFSESYYDVEALLYQDDIGTEARILINEIYEDVNFIGDAIDAISNPELNKARSDKFAELTRLKSKLNLDLSFKTGRDLEIAERLREYFDRRKEFFESKINEDLFYKKYNEAVDDSKYEYDENGNQIPRSPEAEQELLNQWIDNNTTVSIRDEFYEERKALIEKRDAILAPLKEENDKIVDLANLYEQVYEIIRVTRDDSGQYNGFELTPDQQIKLRDIQQEIENSRKELYLNFGLTGNEFQEFMELWTAFSEGYQLDVDEQATLDSYLDTLKNGLNNFGIDESSQKELIAIEKLLSEMSQTIFTVHYLNVFQQFIDSDDNFKIIFEEFLIKIDENFDLTDNYFVKEAHLKELFKGYNSEFLNKLLDSNSDFETFIENNHIKIERQEEQPDGKSVAVNLLRNTSVWQFSQPLSQDAYNTFTIKDEFGNAVGLLRDRNNTLRIPNFNFQNREVKDVYVTAKNTRDYVDKNGNLVIRNWSAKDQWLPKENSKYRSQEYFDMFEKNIALWELTNYIKNWHLDNQEGKPTNKKLDISYPKLRKSGFEDTFTRGYWKRLFYRMGDMFSTRADDFDEGTRIDTRGDINSMEDINELDRPVIGVWDNLPFGLISTDILLTAQRYQHSLQEYSVASKLFPFVNTAERVLTDLNSDGTTQSVNSILKYLSVFGKKDKDRNKAKTVIKINDRYIKGIQLAERSKFNSVIGKWINKATKWTSRKFFMLNPLAGIRNYATGQIQAGILLWDFRNYVTPVDFVIGAAKGNKTLMHYQSRTYSVKEKPVQIQLMEILNASPDHYGTIQGEAGSRNITKDLYQFRIGYYMRTTLTHSFNYQSIYAFMNNKKFKFKLNGKLTTLDNAIEKVDGRIQTKAGVPEEFSISYDANGDVFFGKKIQKLMNVHQDYLLKTVGMGGRNNEGDFMARWNLGKMIFSMMKFIVPMGLYRGGAKVKFDKNAPGYQKLRIQRRRNWFTGNVERGYFLEAMKIGLDIAESGYTGFKKRNFTYSQYVGLMQVVSAVLLTELIRYIIGSMITLVWKTFGPDDEVTEEYATIDEVGGRSGVAFKEWSDNVKLPNLPWVNDDVVGPFDLKEYAKLHLINLLYEVERENETFFLPDLIPTVKGYMTGSSPFFGGIPAEIGRAVDYMGGMSYLSEEEQLKQMNADGVLYQIKDNDSKFLLSKRAGPYWYQQEGQNKIYNIMGRSFGFNGMVLDPAAKFQSNQKFMPRDWRWSKIFEGGKE